MKVNAIRTRLVHPGELTLVALIDETLTALEERTVVVMSSKIVALCQNRVVQKDGNITKGDLIRRESTLFTPDDFNKYGFNFTIVGRTFIPAAGIDESNANDCFVLWPEQPQQMANNLRAYLCERFKLKYVGVIITDSTCLPPMRAGTIGIMLAHSGFVAVKNLVGTPDLFGREFKVARSAIGGGLAAAANVVMGEGAEQTPIAIITEMPSLDFQDHDPSTSELEAVYIDPEEDLYAPFLMSAPWQEGGRGRG